MALAQGLTAIIIFWAIIGGLGASLLLPAMQSLIHGNFEGAAQKAYALVGAAAAIAAAVGPLLGGFITTYLSWRVGFLLEAVVIAIVLSGSSWSATCRTPGRGRSTWSARSSRLWAWAASCSASSSGRRAASRSARSSRSASSRWRRWLVAGAAQARGQADAARSGPVPSKVFRSGLAADAAADRPGRHDDRAADLPADGARVQRDGGGPVAGPLSLSMFAIALLAGRKAGGTGARAHHPAGLRAARDRLVVLIPIVPRADSGWAWWSR